MMIIDSIFEEVKILELSRREDSRGIMSVTYHEKDLSEIGIDFKVKEYRVYTMPTKGIFFGIHYQTSDYPQAKLVSVIQGKGLDYIVDLRPESKTYKQWKVIELCADNAKAVYIPDGFGHAFLSMEDNTIQQFEIDEYFIEDCAKQINYKDPGIGLRLPLKNIILSDYDRNAPYI
jgi:dTDP-4-dehydrorhamnose 3,5-epimerase